jgi:hypothetical protein
MLPNDVRLTGFSASEQFVNLHDPWPALSCVLLCASLARYDDAVALFAPLQIVCGLIARHVRRRRCAVGGPLGAHRRVGCRAYCLPASWPLAAHRLENTVTES